ncbi:hypothetical protein GCM10010255_30820 [Streptomyces coeruleofuscus]|uniref:Uncharacterized protein n=1 Tax=Streptomyces coeruleofuscus TaxID=66879 RepID=A0ABN3I9B3_9ACTN
MTRGRHISTAPHSPTTGRRPPPVRTPQGWPAPPARAARPTHVPPVLGTNPIDRSQQARRVGTQQVPTLPRNHADREPARAGREPRGPDRTYR